MDKQFDYDTQRSMLEDAYWFAEHKMLDTAIAIVDEAFPDFLNFRAWWLAEGMADCPMDPVFVRWVAKIMVFMYMEYNVPEDSDTRTFVDLTMIELRKMKATKA